MKNRLPVARRASLLAFVAVVTVGAAFITPRAIQQSRDTALFDAVCQRDVANVQRLLDAGANPNAPQTVRLFNDTGGAFWRRALRFVWPSQFDSKGLVTVLPLEAALLPSEKNGYPVLQLLLAHGADPNAYEPGRNPPLYVAVAQDDDASAQALLDFGANPNTTGNPQRIGFQISEEESRIENSPFTWDFMPGAPQIKTPLMSAAGRCDLQIVNALFARRADPNAQDDNGETALHKAASYRAPGLDHAATVRALLNAGANPLLETNADGLHGPSKTPAALARWLHRLHRNDLENVEARKKKPDDFSETVRLLEDDEARLKRETKK